jgi:hypothetical protein
MFAAVPENRVGTAGKPYFDQCLQGLARRYGWFLDFLTFGSDATHA